MNDNCYTIQELQLLKEAYQIRRHLSSKRIKLATNQEDYHKEIYLKYHTESST